MNWENNKMKWENKTMKWKKEVKATRFVEDMNEEEFDAYLEDISKADKLIALAILKLDTDINDLFNEASEIYDKYVMTAQVQQGVDHALTQVTSKDLPDFIDMLKNKFMDVL